MRSLYALFLALFSAFSAFSQTQTVWEGDVSTAWADPANWSAGLPDASKRAYVPATPIGPNWPISTANLTIDFLLENAGQIFFQGQTSNTNNIRNFSGGEITSSVGFENRGTLAFDNGGKFVNSALFQNFSTVNQAATAIFDNRLTGVLHNTSSGNFQNAGLILNAGTLLNEGFLNTSATIESSGRITNYKTFFIGAGTGKVVVRSGGLFDNHALASFVEVSGLLEIQAGATARNDGGLKSQVGGKIQINGTLTNLEVINVAGELVNDGVFNNGIPTDTATVWNEMGGKIRNNAALNNYGTLELLMCSYFYQKSSTPVTGKVWLMGIVYELVGTVDKSSIMGGSVYTSETQVKAPSAMCKNITITLGADGKATISASSIDNMSEYEGCFGGSLTVSKTAFDCSNVGANAVVLTAKNRAGDVSTCTATVTVVSSSACLPTFDLSKCYKIVNKESGKVIDTDKGQQLVQWAADGTSSQAFKLESAGDGYFFLTSQWEGGFGSVIDIEGASLADGAKALLFAKHGGQNQQFKFVALADGSYQIVARHSEKGLKLSASPGTDGTGLIQLGLNLAFEHQKWRLVEVACPSAPVPQPVCNKNILFVVGGASCPKSSDALIKCKLEGRGFSVIYKDATTVTTADANGKGLILISSTVLSTDVNTKFKNVQVPVLTWEGQLYDDFSMSTTLGAHAICTQADLTTAAGFVNHPIYAGLNGCQNLTIYCSYETVPFGQVCGAAAFDSKIFGQSKSGLFAYEKGQTMCGGFVAPGRRIAFPAGDYSACNLNATGWRLFFNAIFWATNCQQTYCAESPNWDLTFNAVKKGFDADLIWVSRTGDANDFFVVERSADGMAFEPIATIDAKGEADEILYFKEADKKPLSGANFYRLRLVFRDGTETLTEAQKIDFAATESFDAFPNPAADELFVDLRAFEGRRVEVDFLSLQGQKGQSAIIEKVGDDPARLDVCGLAEGLWLLQIRPDGLRSESKKVFIERGN